MKEITFCKRLKELRLEKGLTQKDLAEFVSVLFYTISDWEAGRSEPNLQTLYKLSQIFDVTVGYLLGVED